MRATRSTRSCAPGAEHAAVARPRRAARSASASSAVAGEHAGVHVRVERGALGRQPAGLALARVATRSRGPGRAGQRRGAAAPRRAPGRACRSMRSSSGPLRRLRWRASSASLQRSARPRREPAGARVGRGEQHEARGVDGRVARADDRDAPVLQRLAQRLERRAGELRELVEEQHAVVGEHDLAGRRCAPPPTRPAARDRVVRRAERARRGAAPPPCARRGCGCA